MNYQLSFCLQTLTSKPTKVNETAELFHGWEHVTADFEFFSCVPMWNANDKGH